MKHNTLFNSFAVSVIVALCFFQSLSAKQDKPKNIILLIGDGMGISAVSTSILTDSSSAFRKFKFVGLSITCSADALITDSAAGATALSTGEKTNNHFIGMSPDKQPLNNIFEEGKKKHYSTGVISTSSITHATPASFFAHVPDRSDEVTIAEQFFESELDIAIGGGRHFFLPESNNGKRKDNIDLTEKFESEGYAYLTTIEDLQNYTGSEKIIALLEDVSLNSATKRTYTLGDLTKAGIDRLSKNEKGFMLMVEGSQIDWGEHENNEKYALAEMADFNKAVGAALDFAEQDGNTLVVVTADHETGGTSIVGGIRDKEVSLGFASKGHTAACVGIFAYGPGAEMFQGVMENNQIGKNLFKIIKGDN